ncbi:hypothetical protein D3C87_1817330 [compost metagenome]
MDGGFGYSRPFAQLQQLFPCQVIQPHGAKTGRQAQFLIERQQPVNLRPIPLQRQLHQHTVSYLAAMQQTVCLRDGCQCIVHRMGTCGTAIILAEPAYKPGDHNNRFSCPGQGIIQLS